MRKLKDLLLGLLMVIVATYIDRRFHAPTVELEMHDDANPSHRGTTHELLPDKETTMQKREIPTWLCVVIFLVGLYLITSLLGCSPRRVESTPAPTPIIVVAPIVHNNLDFLYFAIADRGGLEAWFCMLGFNDPKTGALLIQGITPVWVDSANGSAIIGRPAGCPAKVTVGTIHFHPGIDYYAFSPTDINTAHRLPFQSMAIVCRDNDGQRKVLIVLRKEIDQMWSNIVIDTSKHFSFTPIYRYKR